MFSQVATLVTGVLGASLLWMQFGPKPDLLANVSVDTLAPAFDSHCKRYGDHSAHLGCDLTKPGDGCRAPHVSRHPRDDISQSVSNSPIWDVRMRGDWLGVIKGIFESTQTKLKRRVALTEFFGIVAQMDEKRHLFPQMLEVNNELDGRGLGPLVAPLLGMSCEFHGQMSPLAFRVHAMKRKDSNFPTDRRAAMEMLEHYRPHPMTPQITGCMCGNAVIRPIIDYFPALYEAHAEVAKCMSYNDHDLFRPKEAVACLRRMTTLVGQMSEAKPGPLTLPLEEDQFLKYNLVQPHDYQAADSVETAVHERINLATEFAKLFHRHHVGVVGDHFGNYFHRNDNTGAEAMADFVAELDRVGLMKRTDFCDAMLELGKDEAWTRQHQHFAGEGLTLMMIKLGHVFE